MQHAVKEEVYETEDESWGGMCCEVAIQHSCLFTPLDCLACPTLLLTVSCCTPPKLDRHKLTRSHNNNHLAQLLRRTLRIGRAGRQQKVIER